MSNKGLWTFEVTRVKKNWVAVLRKKGWGIGILREYMYFPVFWDERYAIQKIKTGMHGCVQLDACNCRDGELIRVHVGWYAALMLEGDSKTTMSMPLWQIVVRK